VLPAKDRNRLRTFDLLSLASLLPEGRAPARDLSEEVLPLMWESILMRTPWSLVTTENQGTPLS
jgi:hypothetical protein